MQMRRLSDFAWSVDNAKTHIRFLLLGDDAKAKKLPVFRQEDESFCVCLLCTVDTGNADLAVVYIKILTFRNLDIQCTEK